MTRNISHSPPAKANEQDLAVVLGWLESEYQSDGEGFWSNREVIKRSFEKGNLWVIRDEGDAVAFQVGSYNPDILCVRKDRQYHGFGCTMFEASFARAMDNNVNVLTVECSPISSLPFWMKQGFELYKNVTGLRGPVVRRVLHREFHLPKDMPEVEVTISFFPEAILYNDDVSPLIDDRLCGVFMPSAEIALPHRVIAPDDCTDYKDLVVKVLVHNKERYFDKAKYSDAQVLGIQRDGIGPSFYIDKIFP